MISIVLIGSGNVAQHLITAFLQSNEIELVQVFSRQKESVSHLLSSDKIVSEYNVIKVADIYIIAVSDNAIAGDPFMEAFALNATGKKSSFKVNGFPFTFKKVLGSI